jgi:hypothetical protein
VLGELLRVRLCANLVQKPLDPSMSVKTKVTSPVGRFRVIDAMMQEEPTAWVTNVD